MLLLPEGDGWSLPCFETEENTSRRFQPFTMAGEVSSTVREQLGPDVTVLRCLISERLSDSDRIVRVYAAENRSPGWQPPPGARWIESAALAGLTLAVPEHRTIMEQWMLEHSVGGVPPLRVPWARAGWFGEASAWVHERLDALGYAATGPLEQMRVWTISSVMRIETDRGAVYFKASPPMFAKEPVLTQALFRRYSANIPPVLAVDTERNWMMMGHIGSTTFGEVESMELWEGAMRLLAGIQRDHVERVDELIAIGCPDRRLDELARQIDPLIEDTGSMLPDRPEGLSPKEIATVRSIAPRLKEMCEELAEFSVPPTLKHGDLDAGNMFLQDGNCILMDWSDACVSHPFFTPHNISRVRKSGPRLRDVYLSRWTDYEPMDRLVKAFQLAEPLRLLHQALSYQRYILPYLEPGARWELDDFVPSLLRSLLRRMGQSV